MAKWFSGYVDPCGVLDGDHFRNSGIAIAENPAIAAQIAAEHNHYEALIKAVDVAETALGENLVWLADQLNLGIRQKDPETIAKLAQLNEAWKTLVMARAPTKPGAP